MKSSREVVQQRVGRLARLAAVQEAAVVLDAAAGPHLLHHLHVVDDALVEPLQFDDLACGAELILPFLQLHLDVADGGFELVLGGHVVGLGPDGEFIQLFRHDAAQGVDLGETLHFVAPELDAVGHILIGRVDLHHVAPHPEDAWLEAQVVALVLDGHQVAQQDGPIECLAHLQAYGQVHVRRRIPQAVDAD